MSDEYDWKLQLCKKKEDRKASCFISPDGRWFNVGYGDHWAFTKAVMKEVYGRDYGGLYSEVKIAIDGDFRKLEEELYEKGWVWVHDDIMSGTMVRGRMNEKQYKVLKESFGNARLMRGWTIDMLYHEQRG